MKIFSFEVQRFANIENEVNNTVIAGTADADIIENDGANVTIFGGGGNDSIENDGANVLIDGEDGNDFIENDGSNVLIFGGDGNDFIVSDNQNVTINGGLGDDSIFFDSDSSHNNVIYASDCGNDSISGFKSDDTLTFAATYTGWTTEANDLIIGAAEGSVRITEAKNKWIPLADGNGNLAVHVFLSAGYEGALDGRSLSTFTVITGSDNISNQIYAGSGGSSLYGNNGGNDELYGNVGIDEFVYKYGDGQDNIFNAGAEDAVNFVGMSLDQIWAAQIYDNGVNLIFTDGGALSINGQVGNFILGGQSYGADYQSKTWYTK